MSQTDFVRSKRRRKRNDSEEACAELQACLYQQPCRVVVAQTTWSTYFNEADYSMFRRPTNHITTVQLVGYCFKFTNTSVWNWTEGIIDGISFIRSLSLVLWFAVTKEPGLKTLLEVRTYREAHRLHKPSYLQQSTSSFVLGEPDLVVRNLAQKLL